MGYSSKHRFATVSAFYTTHVAFFDDYNRTTIFHLYESLYLSYCIQFKIWIPPPPPQPTEHWYFTCWIECNINIKIKWFTQHFKVNQYLKKKLQMHIIFNLKPKHCWVSQRYGKSLSLKKNQVSEGQDSSIVPFTLGFILIHISLSQALTRDKKFVSKIQSFLFNQILLLG